MPSRCVLNAIATYTIITVRTLIEDGRNDSCSGFDFMRTSLL